MNELETILYGYICQSGEDGFGISKPQNQDFLELWENLDESDLLIYSNKQIWKAALSLEKKGIITVDRTFDEEVADCRFLTPHEIVERKVVNPSYAIISEKLRRYE